MRWNPRIRRVLRALLIGFAALAGILVLAVLVLLLQPAREGILRQALHVVGDALPGTLDVGGARWPAPGRFEFESVDWVLDGSSLARCTTVVLEVDLGALWSKDIHARELTLLGVEAHLPAIRAAFDPGDAVTLVDPHDTGPESGSFPREGSLPWAPSIAVDSLRVELLALTVPDSTRLQARLSAGLNLLAGHAPVLDLRELDAGWIEPGWSARSPGFRVDAASGLLAGSVELGLGAAREFSLILESDTPRQFRLSLARRGEAPASGAPGLGLEGRFTQLASGAIDSLEFQAELLTPESGELEQLLGRPGLLVAAAPLGQLRVQAEGTVGLVSGLRSFASVRVGATGWPGELKARLRTNGTTVEVDELTLQADGLQLDAKGRMEGGAWSSELHADVAGVAFLDSLVAAGTVPRDLRGWIEFEAAGRGAVIDPALRLGGAAPSAGVDSLHVALGGRVDGARTDLRLRAATLFRDAIAIGVQARVADLDAPRVHLAPIQVATGLAGLRDADPPVSATLRIDRLGRSVAVDGLQVTGVAGELRIDAQLSEDGAGSGTLAVRWPVPPPALELLGFGAATRDSLLAPGWSVGGVPGVDLAFEAPSGIRSGTATARIDLPAPWKLVPDLPARAYDAPDLLGSLQARWSADRSWRAELDFSQTAWLDSAFVHAAGEEASLHLDSLLIRGGPLRATAAAHLDSNALDGKVQVDLSSHPVVSLLVPSLPEDLQFLANLRVGLAGTREAPDARARLLASARSPGLDFPLLSAEAEVVAGLVQQARIEVPEAGRIGELRVERARVDLIPEDPAQGLLPLRAGAELRGDLTWIQVARLDSIDGALELRTDSLAVGAYGELLRSQRPFDLRFAPKDSVVRLTGLDLAGTPGTVTASLDLGPRTAQADVAIHLDASLPSVLARTPVEMLPSGYHLVFAGTESDLDLQFWLEGLDLGTRRDVLARIEAHREGSQFEIDVHARDALGVLATGQVTLPLDADLLDRRFEWQDGPLSGTVTVDSLPLPYQIGGRRGLGDYLLGSHDPSAPLLDARFAVGGTGRSPVGGAILQVRFPGIEELAEDQLDLGAVWIGREGDPASTGLFEDPALLLRLRESIPFGGLALNGSLRRSGVERASVGLKLPLAEDATSPLPSFGPKDRLIFDLSAEPLRLGEWNALVPKGTEISGDLYLSAHSDGPIGDLPLDAKIRLQEVRLQQNFGSSATVDGEILVSGRSTAPVIEGRLRVPSALIRLPDSERELHPVAGESRLWALEEMSPERFAAVDTIQVGWGWAFAPAEEAPASEAGETRLSLAETTRLNVALEIPNSFWIRGQGLEVQLAGELHLVSEDGEPKLAGELRAIGGSLEVVGARLRLDRGTVSFYGGDTTDPALDLQLSRSQGDVRVIVNVTGTARKPNLVFDSDPPMSQTDIMSYLLFGSAAGDLDGAQTQLLQDQAAIALSQFAAPVLENELTQSLGISMVQLQAGEDPEDGLSLVVGKYVTPQILVKYEQSLKDRQKYTVNAEYWLNRFFRVESQLSESRSTGIHLYWSRDY